ncbi:TRAP transporter large permease [Ollibium composti]|uniref:TRAP transporter large permease subunit n=1 Tax=Ollibium composti TaxID=2675109 RepID=A0ABY2QB61_9HYPH|nr:TRAP transporter large permease subunit [Mesorhizobium composti]THF59047.1 TRAP transporter large permease subunit [Mesorhizobium composti]
MIEFIAQNMAPIMFASLIIFLLIGYPVAFSLAANGLLFFVIGVELAPLSAGSINLSWPLLYALPDRFYGGVMANDTLLAIPFFTFMGIVLERSGMAEDLLDTIGQLFGPVRGGLAYAVILVGALLAATTGVVAASVIAMGLISLPIMLRYGYDRRLASGVIAASGTLAQIIPPSLVLIVLADQLGRSVGDMYAGALIPGLVLTGLYMSYVLVTSIIKPDWAPALPAEARTLGHGITSLIFALLAAVAIAYGAYRYLEPTQGENADILAATVGIIAIYIVAIVDKALNLNLMSRLAQQVVIVLIPPLALVFLVLGTIFLGIATPTEGGAMGAVGALFMAAAKRRLTLDVVKQALASTTRLSSFVLFILIGSRVFSLTFYGVNGHLWVEYLLVSLPGGELGFLIVVNLLVFFLAFFLDFFELAFIIVPLLAPAAEKLGIDLIWFGVLLGVNMQTSFMHPPFGFALFYLRSVAARVPYLDRITGKQIAPVTTGQIYWGAVPFVLIQVLMIALTILFPQMVMHYKGKVVDPGSIEIKMPELPGLSLPPLGAPAAPQGGTAPAAPDLSQPPNFGGTPAPQPAAPATPDLSQPPNFGDAPAQPAAPAAPDLSKPPSFD